MRTFFRCALVTLALLSVACCLNVDHYPGMVAIRGIVTLHTAQTQYRQYGSYAANLRNLGPDDADLIPADLAKGNKHGYEFHMTGSVSHYAITASPTDPNLRHSFYSDETLVIRESWSSEPAGPHHREIR